MTQNASFVRKVIYIATIAVLLMPLAYLSQPAVFTKQGISHGGKLAGLRREYGMAEAELGEIDPASDTMRLAALGLDGVAVSVLWIQANEYKKKKNAAGVELATEQIVNLAPQFKSVWEFKAHNLSYNLSVEFDNFEHRYLWVKKGIEFLIKGTRKNRGEPILFWHLGWYTGQKLGMSDEKIQFRKLYRVDKDFHNLFRENGIDVDQALGPDNKPDNWFTAFLWYDKGRYFADERGRPIRGKSPLIFHNQPSMSIINGCTAMEKEGYLGDFAIQKWKTAAEEFGRYGSRPIPTSWGQVIRLGDKEGLEERVQQLVTALDALAPGERKKLEDAKIAKLVAAEQEILNKATEDRSAAEEMQARELKTRVAVNDAEVAAKAPPENRVQARLLADQITEARISMTRIESYRRIVNFVYWRDRCEAEQLEDSLAARDHLFKAEEAFRKTDLTLAKAEYEKSFQAWANVYKKYPVLMDNTESQDLVESCKQYNNVLGQLDLEFPADFVLNNLLDLFDEGVKLRALQAKSSKAVPSEPHKDKESKSDPVKPDADKSGLPKEPDAPKETDKPAPPTGKEEAKPKEETSPKEEAKPTEKPAKEPAGPAEDSPAGKEKPDQPPPAKPEPSPDKSPSQSTEN